MHFIFNPSWFGGVRNSPHCRDEGKEVKKHKKQLSENPHSKQLTRNIQRLYSSLAFSGFPPSHSRVAVATRKRRALTFCCKSRVGQSSRTHDQHQGVHRCQSTSFPNDPQSSVSSPKNKGSHKRVVTY